MSKFTEDAKLLLEYIGGKDNIKAVTHCVTRMRFVLIDEKKADVKKIESLKSAKGTFTQAGQFQVIIGNEVSEFYNEFTKIAGIDGVSKDAVKAAAKSNQTFVQKLMANLAEIFTPLIPALICGGLILGFRSVIGDIKLVEDGTKTLVETSQFFAGLYSFLWLIGEAIFHFLPVGIVWSITRKMGTTQILGIILGLTLVSPQLLNAYNMAPGTVPPVWDFGFVQIEMVGYQAQVIPAILAAFILVYLEKFWRRITPDYISMIIVPLFSLIPAVILAHTVVGPIGWAIGSFIANAVYAGLTSSFGWLFAGVFGFFYAPLVITGLHHMTNAIDLQLMSQFNGTILWPMVALSNIAQGSAVLAMIFLQRKNERAKQINVPACISCYLGVTEPALFGVNLKYGFPFICGLVGSCIAAMISVSSGVMASSIGVGGIPGILSIKPQFMFMFFIAMIVAFCIPFILTTVVGKKKLTSEDVSGVDIKQAEFTETENIDSEENKVDTVAENFQAPITGITKKLSDIEDKGFASGAMGEGFAIEMQDGKVVAPFSGEVMVCFPTGHAYGLKSNDGKEILIHIGMDTVELDGKGFDVKVQAGQKIKQGDVLVNVDIDYVKSQGKSLVTPIVFTDGRKVELLQENVAVKAGDENIIKL
ncbi:MAG: PTS system trehalose-specific EIIBC component [Megamonas funiformis]|jgi:PTS system trehalose-specific IIC component|uniref:PTS system trehalose-specific EIIBC component n=1 Tax=Megamonas TaxID=158846 RepID=UPI000E402BD6|nr:MULTISPECIES: PTS system trehalose-specific EIIBC component [Megamonas]MDY3874764.1 PTS system trehalose-specific EIIBC component [Megamonas funiformis]RGO04035.1 PTS trehalose transporter subunit IIBC [Megamonas rupellensis]